MTIIAFIGSSIGAGMAATRENCGDDTAGLPRRGWGAERLPPVVVVAEEDLEDETDGHAAFSLVGALLAKPAIAERDFRQKPLPQNLE